MKISYIIQSYLGEYPGSRSNSDKKFLRAVQSFIDQEDKESELIIVSDGCEITHKLYYKHFKSNSRIKYVYVDKNTPNMYEGDQKYYRGLPREIGRTLVTGEITTYMDSDDFLLPNHSSVLSKYWDCNKNATSIINRSWYDNIKSLNFKPYASEIRSNIIKINISGLDGEWYATKLKNEDNKVHFVYTPWLLSHKSNIKTKWRDVVGEGFSEDVIFGKQVLDEGIALHIEYPLYVRCHYSGKWDY